MHVIMPLGPALAINGTRWIVRKLYRVSRRAVLLVWRVVAALARYAALEVRSRRARRLRGEDGGVVVPFRR